MKRYYVIPRIFDGASMTHTNGFVLGHRYPAERVNERCLMAVLLSGAERLIMVDPVTGDGDGGAHLTYRKPEQFSPRYAPEVVRTAGYFEIVTEEVPDEEPEVLEPCCIDGWVPGDTGVERCDDCRRFETDDDARDHVAMILRTLWVQYASDDDEEDDVVLTHIRRALREGEFDPNEPDYVGHSEPQEDE